VLSALRAEVVKLGLAVLLLWIVLVNYAEGGGRRLRRSVPRHDADIRHGVFCARLLMADKWLQHELTPSEYIQHHLSFFQEPLARTVSGRSTLILS